MLEFLKNSELTGKNREISSTTQYEALEIVGNSKTYMEIPYSADQGIF